MAILPNSVTVADLLRWVQANPNNPFDPNMVINATHTSDWQWQAVVDQMERLRVQGYQTRVKQDPTGSTYWIITPKGENYLRAMERAEQAVETKNPGDQVQGQPTPDNVMPPLIVKAFGAASLPLNGITTLTFTITNQNKTTQLTEIGFIDFLPAGLVISRPNGLVGSWAGGQLIAREGSDVVNLEDAILPGGGSCAFQLNVTGVTPGVKNNTTRNIVSKEGGRGNTASASISVLVSGSQSLAGANEGKSSASQPSPSVSREQEGSQATADAASSRLPDVWMLSDRPLENHFDEQDRFQFKDYANALAAIIDHDRTETPFTMAINAPWGAGKTTLANMISVLLEQRPKDRGEAPHIICWFNAWLHDDAPNLASAFVAKIGRKADSSRKWFKRILSPLPAALLEPSKRKRRQLGVGLPVVGVSLLLFIWITSHLLHIDQQKKNEGTRAETKQTTASTDSSGKTSKSEVYTQSHSQPVPVVSGKDRADHLLEVIQSGLLVLSAFVTASAGLLALLIKIFSSSPLGGFVQAPDKVAEAGAIPAAHEQLREIISQATWRGNRLIVFVDDIERCKPPRSVEILDAVNQLMDHPNVVVVFLGDMSAVAAAVQLKYKDIAEIFVPSAGIAQSAPDGGKEAFGRLYLQKIIQFQFDLPIPPMSNIEAYMQQLAAASQARGNDHGRV